MTSRPPPRTIITRSKPSVSTSRNSMSAMGVVRISRVLVCHCFLILTGRVFVGADGLGRTRQVEND